MKANEIRQRFLDFFAANGHQKVASSGLAPKDDPSLMFTNAGMVQFKRVFLGQEKRDYRRAVTSQKCLRVGGKHNDLENVGRTARHHTFFEMLGNFSFGDYFKEEAIGFAWDFLTKELALPKDRLYVTIYRDDDEAAALWRKVTGIAPERIFRLGEKDNFWSMGDTGPCGPCSEIIFDQGEAMTCGPGCGIGSCDCDRFLEIWNLVFMQYDQITPDRREPLPRPSIDTGMGLERIAAVVQGVTSNYDCDLFQEIIGFAAAKAGVTYKAQGEDADTALRVMADHCRSMAFMVADGILPSNEGRGYVLRRLIRRAYRFGRLIGMSGTFLHEVALKVVEVMGEAYPEIRGNAAFMARVVREEEDRFANTLDKGLALLDEELAKLPAGTTLAGQVAFKLYDTYGFPIDIVNDIAEKRGVAVDEAGFNALMAEQKERAKAAWKGSGEVDLGSRFKALLEDGVTSEFVGYDTLAASSRVTALLDAAAQPVDRLSTGERGFVVAAATPFYGESGGQAGDTGAIATPEGKAEVADTLKPAPALTVHSVEVVSGAISAGAEAVLTVDEEARLATARNHTATHLLHAALRQVLGEHVKQAGSLVGPDRLRFDFTHVSAVTAEELARVEDLVNRAVLGDTTLAISTMDHQTAVRKGAMALFGEKYGDSVRVVEVPGVSIELCGGTHLRATGQVGPFLVTSESGVAAGVRRIEAATGLNALAAIAAQRRELTELSGLLKSRPGELAGKVSGLQKEVKALHKEAERLASQAASGKGRDLMDEVREINGVKVLAAAVNAPNIKALRDLMDDVRSKLPSGVACLASAADGKVSLILYVSKDLHGRYTAPALIKDVAALVGGSGGGRPDLAQAGGADPDAIPAALAKLAELI
ncbi:MAG: alanine--tRNA ligase [Thermodesulfobacteriota bacterium]